MRLVVIIALEISFINNAQPIVKSFKSSVTASMCLDIVALFLIYYLEDADHYLKIYVEFKRIYRDITKEDQRNYLN